MTNPFLAPNRVPPPATRTLLPGTAQPYYPGDPVPNSPVIGAPPVGFAPGATQQPGYQPTAPTTPTYAPQPAGVVPPGGWNTAPQQIPQGSSSRNVLPTNIQPASATMPVMVQPDQQNLRFTQQATLPPDPSILPTPQQGVSPYLNQQAGFQAPLPPQPLIQQSVPNGEPRQVRIRAISSENLRSNGNRAGSRDGFRPQGSSQVRKPTMVSRITTRRREPVNRFGFDPQYGWLRGQLQYASETGQWSMKYLPSQGNVDALGGNLPIANPQVLGDLQPGDYVQLRGRVEQGQFNGSPSYTVSVVQRQRI
ncbi:MAG: hypothetical protein GXP24_00430 [Planctomycetes bacterium]|nr:hypothetical protein [Planctomycetota bacterium]